ncbi:MAG: lipoyl(octanoyl) transferase LipB [Ignavibacteriaceae bacterium]
MNRILNYLNFDILDYNIAWNIQKEIFDLRIKNRIEDTIILLQHPHTYTLGKTANKKHLISNPEFLKKNQISVFDIDRGGDITYHGPGQIVGYPIINLSDWKQDTHKYLRALEEVIIRTCSDYNLSTGRNSAYTGVWIDERKIAAIGIKVSRWITMHGFAFNISTDLKFFNGIIPCGITDKAVTSLEIETGSKVSVNEVKENLLKNFKNVFSYDEVSVGNYEEISALGLSHN